MKPSIEKRIQGRRSQGQGQLYEKIFQLNARAQGLTCIRIPDGCKQRRNVIVRVKSPFDWVLKWNDEIAFLDTKSTQSDRIRYSDLAEHQVIALKALSSKYAKAGFVVFYTTHGIASFFDVQDLSPGTSMAFTEGKKLGFIRSLNLSQIFL
jgi:penicillin-binding protein-related factor A (putative recombinase)